tara:strand:- start:26580 stop:27320 length:741 start_codon:yes stop_codon:yes gene_type:complete
MKAFELDFFKKYDKEEILLRDGIYSQFDCRVLYSYVREFKPKRILEFAPRTGRTTSCIMEALKKNNEEDGLEVEYFAFEKDEEFFKSTREFIKSFSFVNLKYDSNIIGSRLLNKIEGLDFLLIDANHDFLLAEWYVENLFPSVKSQGHIHIHDIDYNKNKNGWEDISFGKSYHSHPDVIHSEVIKKLYPSLSFKVPSVIKTFEGDIIKKFYEENKDNLEFYSTPEASRKLNCYNEFDRSMYFKLKI